MSTESTATPNVRGTRSGSLAAAARALIIAAAAVAAVVYLIHAVTSLTGRTLLAFGGADGTLPLSHLNQVLFAEVRTGAGALADADLLLRVLAAVPSVIQAITVVAAVAVLLPIVRSVSERSPFAAVVLRGWRLLATVLVTGGLLQGIADTVAGVYLATHLGLFGAAPPQPGAQEAFLGADYVAVSVNTPQWPVATIVAGIVAFTLLLAFRAGARLEREVVGVV